jgi:hypothetical protein
VNILFATPGDVQPVLSCLKETVSNFKQPCCAKVVVDVVVGVCVVVLVVVGVAVVVLVVVGVCVLVVVVVSQDTTPVTTPTVLI